MPVLKHVHKYIKFKSRSGYLRCEDTVCTHYILKELAIGKVSRCSKCLSEFTLTIEDLRRVRPLCPNCSNTKEARTRRKAEAFINSIVNNQESDVPDPDIPELEWDNDKF
jgi:hypothetical protein